MPVTKSARTQAAQKPFKCYECGKTMSLAQAEKMECPKCGGGDIDINDGKR